MSDAVAAKSVYMPILSYCPPLLVPPDPKIAASTRVVNPTTRMSPIDPTSEVLPPSESAIADTGARWFYLTPKAICANINPTAVKIFVSTAGGPPQKSSA